MYGLKTPLFYATLVICACLALSAARAAAAFDEGWVILSFDTRYTVQRDGSIDVIEDIRVDFGSLQRHGIFREIPVEYRYDPDPDFRRQMPITVRAVDDGAVSHKYETSRVGANLRIKIGDPDRYVTGQQRYRISYTVRGAMNAFEDHDEFYWNVTGHGWPVRVQRATATVAGEGLQSAACYVGRVGSTARCAAEVAGNGSEARFTTAGPLGVEEGMTIVVGVRKGVVEVEPPILKTAPGLPTLREMAGLKPAPIAAAVVLAVLVFGAVGRMWWLGGRDRWLGDVHYLTGDANERRRPLFARETVVVEYTPPDMPDRRRLRPAEIGVLMDERADTLDVSATIVDLAVRGFVVIRDEGNKDWLLVKKREADKELLPYETRLFQALFRGRDEVLLSDLKESFYKDLAKVKKDLYQQSVGSNHFFSANPETTRTLYLLAGVGLLAAGVVATVFLGFVNVGVIGVPFVFGGLAVAALSGAMPRRTGKGREMYRRALGFREFMETAETERQRFYEEENIFDKYLPYAIVFRCTGKWAKAFQGMESAPSEHAWYVSPRPFLVQSFVRDVESFSSSVSSAIASTPASSGSSGFSSGGFSGGGGGGGGGGSW